MGHKVKHWSLKQATVSWILRLSIHGSSQTAKLPNDVPRCLMPYHLWNKEDCPGQTHTVDIQYIIVK